MQRSSLALILAGSLTIACATAKAQNPPVISDPEYYYTSGNPPIFPTTTGNGMYHNANTSGQPAAYYLGADGGFMAPLNSQQSVWMMSDTYISATQASNRAVYNGSTYSSAPLIHNCIATATNDTQGGLFLPTYYYKLNSSGGPAEFFTSFSGTELPPNGSQFFWPRHTFTYNNQLFVFLYSITAATAGYPYSYPGMYIARINNPTASPVAWQYDLLRVGSQYDPTSQQYGPVNNPLMGWTTFLLGDGNLYIYSVAYASSSHYAVNLNQIPLSNLVDATPWSDVTLNPSTGALNTKYWASTSQGQGFLPGLTASNALDIFSTVPAGLTAAVSRAVAAGYPSTSATTNAYMGFSSRWNSQANAWQLLVINNNDGANQTTPDNAAAFALKSPQPYGPWDSNTATLVHYFPEKNPNNTTGNNTTLGNPMYHDDAYIYDINEIFEYESNYNTIVAFNYSSNEQFADTNWSPPPTQLQNVPWIATSMNYYTINLVEVYNPFTTSGGWAPDQGNAATRAMKAKFGAKSAKPTSNGARLKIKK